MKSHLVLVLALSAALAQIAGAEEQQQKKQPAHAVRRPVAHAPQHAVVNRNANLQHRPQNFSGNTNPNHAAAYRGQQQQQRFQQNPHQTNVVNRNITVNRGGNAALANRWSHGGRTWSFNQARSHFVRERHDRGWWNAHYSRFVLFGGGYYYWNNGYWFPAYGYDPGYSTYVYNGPIYSYNDLPPDQILYSVQGALQQQGYYGGPIDGDIGPQTQQALASYQRDQGLEVTGAVDGPTLETLGLI